MELEPHIAQILTDQDHISLLPQNSSLAEILAITASVLDAIASEPVERLGLSARSTNCLRTYQVDTIGVLAHLPLCQLMWMHALGKKSAHEILVSLWAYAIKNQEAIASNLTRYPAHFERSVEDWTPLTLRHEWELFSWHADSRLPLMLLSLSLEILQRLGLDPESDLDTLLDWTWDALQEALGEDLAREVLESLISLAQIGRATGQSLDYMIVPSAEELQALLKQRWVNAPLPKQKLSPPLFQCLKQQKIVRFGQLLEALSPLRPFLQIDVASFMEIGEYLNAIGLWQEEPFEAWERLLAEHPAPVTLYAVVEEIFAACSERQWEVLNLRYGLLNPFGEADEATRGTLEAVAMELYITRERVRQIEITALRTLANAERPLQNALLSLLHFLIHSAGGVILVSDLAKQVTQYIAPGNVNAAALCLLMLEQSQKVKAIQRGNIYSVEPMSPVIYAQVLAEAQRITQGNVHGLELEEMAEEVAQTLEVTGVSIPLLSIIACLRTTTRFSTGYQPKDLTSHLVKTLQSIGRPAHFTEIAAHLNASGWRKGEVSEKAVNGRLGSERGLFVFVDRGTYGLVEWGEADRRVFDRQRSFGLIGDIIEEFLTYRGEPVLLKEIVEYVLQKKRCQESSVYQRLLMDSRFCAFGWGKYGLKKWDPFALPFL